MLLWALARLRADLRLDLWAAHLDHALDDGSADRADAAAALARALDVDFECERVGDLRAENPGVSLEAAARRRRYEFLRRCRERHGADWIAVGHHRDDQVETVLLRLLFGSGLAGLGAMRVRRDDVLRPLLTVSRAQVAAVADAQRLEVSDDPGNLDLRRPRNLVRHRLRPFLEDREGFHTDDLADLATAAQGAVAAIDARMAEWIDLRIGDRRADLDLAGLRRLAPPLRPFALRCLHLAAGAQVAPRKRAQRDLDRQLAARSKVGCDCGEGWRWRSIGNRLALSRVSTGVADFSYTLRVPGELPIPELNATLRIVEAEQDGWMFEGSRVRAAMSLPLAAGQHVQIRNRRPGDRMRPFGCAYERKLKDILIDRGIARDERSALPLVVVDGEIAWVPGVTIDDKFRIRPGDRPWVAELLSTNRAFSDNDNPPLGGAERKAP